MQSSRCKILVQQELNNLGFENRCIELGTVHVNGNIQPMHWGMLKLQLHSVGLELIDTQKCSISDLIKRFVSEILNSPDVQSEMTISSYLVQKLNLEYNKIAKSFSECNRQTLKQYVIIERVKKVKELMAIKNNSLIDISTKLHYSSTAHLCTEFKRVTGFTPKIFRSHL